jgi:hypothetical protein
MRAQDFEVSQPVAQAQFVVCLELKAMAGSADTLEILSSIWIPCPQAPD